MKSSSAGSPVQNLLRAAAQSVSAVFERAQAAIEKELSLAASKAAASQAAAAEHEAGREAAAAEAEAAHEVAAAAQAEAAAALEAAAEAKEAEREAQRDAMELRGELSEAQSQVEWRQIELAKSKETSGAWEAHSRDLQGRVYELQRELAETKRLLAASKASARAAATTAAAELAATKAMAGAAAKELAARNAAAAAARTSAVVAAGMLASSPAPDDAGSDDDYESWQPPAPESEASDESGAESAPALDADGRILVCVANFDGAVLTFRSRPNVRVYSVKRAFHRQVSKHELDECKCSFELSVRGCRMADNHTLEDCGVVHGSTIRASAPTAKGAFAGGRAVSKA